MQTIFILTYSESDMQSSVLGVFDNLEAAMTTIRTGGQTSWEYRPGPRCWDLEHANPTQGCYWHIYPHPLNTAPMPLGNTTYRQAYIPAPRDDEDSE